MSDGTIQFTDIKLWTTEDRVQFVLERWPEEARSALLAALLADAPVVELAEMVHGPWLDMTRDAPRDQLEPGRYRLVKVEEE